MVSTQDLATRIDAAIAPMASSEVLWLCTVVSMAMIVLLLITKRSGVEKGKHIGAE